MNFVYPYILWGLLAVTVPILVHLFNFRRFRKIYFTNVRFIRDLKQQTQKQSRLRHLVILCLRILAIACLVIAFSQPYIPKSRSMVKPEAENAISIYVDNSFSMEARSTQGMLLDIAKTKAREIAAAYRSSDLFQLLTNDFEGKHQRLVSRDEFQDLLDEVTISPSVRNLSEVFSRQADLLKNQQIRGKFAFIISDFQQSISDLDHFRADSTILTWLVPLKAVQKDNLYIDSCWFESPVHQLNQGVKLIVSIRNDSGTDFDKIPVKLTINGNQKALASFDVKAGASEEIVLPFTNYTSGIQFGTLEVTDYPIVYDDQFYFVYDVAQSIPVLCINGKEQNAYLNSLFGKDSAFSFTNLPIQSIQYDILSQYRLIILNEPDHVSSGLSQELAGFISNGGTLLVIPSPDADLENYRSFLEQAGEIYYTEKITGNTKVSDIDRENPVFNDVFEPSFKNKVQENMDYPVVTAYYIINRQSRSGFMPVMKLQDGNVFLGAEPSGKGMVYLLAVPLREEFSNFPKHALFVPALYKIALLSEASDPLFCAIGRDEAIELRNAITDAENVYKISQVNGSYEFIPEQQNLNKQVNFYVHGQVRTAGLYELKEGNKIVKGLAFNYDRRESSMNCLDEGTLRNLIQKSGLKTFDVLKETGKPLTETIKEMNQGIRIWKLFIIFALVFLAGEVILLRMWS
jgi:hypothetical protein